jgi:inhibitor of KinA sporulation pathway (predicted exonuclease)
MSGRAHVHVSILLASGDTKLKQPDYYLVIDLEATCDNKNTVPKSQMEIIEIGAVLADADTLEPIDELQTFVRPVRHPKLTPFCTELTSITQDMVADAPLFPAAIAALRGFIGEKSVLFCSWGNYDKNQFEQDARHHRVSLPFRNQHLNLKEAFSAANGSRRKFGMAGALRRVGITLEGTHHRGIDDARNIARLLPYCLAKEVIPPRGQG